MAMVPYGGPVGAGIVVTESNRPAAAILPPAQG